MNTVIDLETKEMYIDNKNKLFTLHKYSDEKDSSIRRGGSIK